MRNFTFDGRLGRDAELCTTKDGKSYIRFTVANNIYYKGEDRTDWYDVTCYDPFIVTNRAKYLTKGTFVLISGNLISDAKVTEGKMWLNHYVTATSVEIPKLGGKSQGGEETQSEEPAVSVYTANTQSSVIAHAPAPAASPAYVSAGGVSTGLPEYSAPNFSDSDDLPF